MSGFLTMFLSLFTQMNVYTRNYISQFRLYNCTKKKIMVLLVAELK